MASVSYRRQAADGELELEQPCGDLARVSWGKRRRRARLYRCVHGANKLCEKNSDLIEFGSDTASGERERESRRERERKKDGGGGNSGWCWAGLGPARWLARAGWPLFIFFYRT